MRNITFRYLISLFVIFILATIISFPSQAKETFAEKCQRLQRESDAEFVAGLERDGNLTQEAIDAFHLEGKKPQKKTTKKKSATTSGTTTNTGGAGKGWVFTSDELHVINLPEDAETGYTVSGWYGNPEQ